MPKRTKTISLRSVKFSDCHQLWLWRNHPRVRQYAFNTNKVSWEEHKHWFEVKIKDPNTRIYIASLDEDVAVGVIRFEEVNNHVKVSVNLNPEFFGRGLGVGIIKLGTEQFLKDAKTKKPILAEIKNENTASLKAFAKAGYETVANHSDDCFKKLFFKEKTQKLPGSLEPDKT